MPQKPAISNLNLPPIKTVDGKTVKVGATYSYKSNHYSRDARPVKCVAVNLNRRQWTAQSDNGAEFTVRPSSRHNPIASSPLYWLRKEVQEARSAVSRNLSYSKDAQKQLNESRKKLARLESALKKKGTQ